MTDGTSPTKATPEKVWYEANCHCGNVKYKFLAPKLEDAKLMSCNCSICEKNGYVNVYPKRDEFVFHTGFDTLKKYRFGAGDKDHMFCPNCGSSIMVDFNKTLMEYFGDAVGMNVRMIKDIDMDKLTTQRYDGKNLMDPKYEV
ncbi:hypothetical protein MMC19_005908 [Ptychographa xylographoides]|nr:hypothetical protein [Ptychographa xylographoides]